MNRKEFSPPRTAKIQRSLPLRTISLRYATVDPPGVGEKIFTKKIFVTSIVLRVSVCVERWSLCGAGERGCGWELIG